MDNIAYIDIEVIINSGKIDRLGLLLNDIKKSTTSISDIKLVLEQNKPNFVCGHNFVDHDSKFLAQTTLNPILQTIPIIDTLFLSMLLFVNKKTHKLDKPYKTEINIENEPLGDAQETKSLFILLDKKFTTLDSELQDIFLSLLYNNRYFYGYFKYKNRVPVEVNIYDIIKDKIYCTKEIFEDIATNYPAELSFVISYLYLDNQASVSSVILICQPYFRQII